MNNADKPAYPQPEIIHDISDRALPDDLWGLTKREKYCLENKVPRTGDPELDKIIIQSLHQDAAMAAMQGILGKQAGTGDQLGDLTVTNIDKTIDASCQFANELVKKLRTYEDE